MINPYTEPEVIRVVRLFCNKFYQGTSPRTLILGINPGRFGAGITGISFTDPVALEENCGMENSFIKRPELSSTFVYEFIDAFGGPVAFYKKYLLSAVCPVGFLKGSTNFNFYDSPALLKASEGFIFSTLKQQAELGIHRKTVIALGKKNGLLLSRFNEKLMLFDSVVELDHPRYIMQYKRRFVRSYIDKYLKVLS